MGCFMAVCVVLMRTAVRICCSDFDSVFLGVPVMHMVQMAVIEVVDMVTMLDGDVTAAWSVRV
jgi:hypothetical protein